MNVVIYSKNRACQLDALLRSLKKNFAQYDTSLVSVIWKGDKGFKGGYTKIKNKFPEVNMIHEDNFKQQTLGCIDEEQDFTMFLVDDIIFKAPFSEHDSQFQSMRIASYIWCTSLRLDCNTTHCYALNSSQEIPKTLSPEFPSWRWSEATGDWNYPMSLDGNVYHTNQIKKVVRSLDFSNPNELESKMDQFAKQPVGVPGTMVCYYDKSRLFNVPANRVQDDYKNRVENSFSVEDLNNKFYHENLVIDISEVSSVKTTSCHHPFEYTFVEDIE